MARQFLNFGDGADGNLEVSSNVTDAPIDSGCSGASGGKSLSATNASFVAGQTILIHQSRGTGVGSWEINKIASYSAGTITTSFDLENTYTDSGASQAQVIVMKEYSSIEIQSGKTLSAKAWNGNVGGIIAYLCSGTLTIVGTVSASVKGYRGVTSDTGAHETGKQGEGSVGAGGAKSISRNGTGGGGGTPFYSGDPNNTGAGAGGGHATAGESTSNGRSQGGTTGCTADLTTMMFGGAGGSGGVGADESHTGGKGGNGGGIIVILASVIAEITGSVVSAGEAGAAGFGNQGQGGGSGAGGSILLKSQTATLGTAKVTALGHTTRADGGAGRIRAEACALTGTTNPGASEEEGGQNWCGGVASIMES